MDISLSVEAVAVAIAVGYLLEKQIINVTIITNRHEWSSPGSRASESIPCRCRSAVVHARRAFAQSHTVGGQLANQAAGDAARNGIVQALNDQCGVERRRRRIGGVRTPHPHAWGRGSAAAQAASYGRPRSARRDG